jgi:hypothetical protein
VHVGEEARHPAVVEAFGEPGVASVVTSIGPSTRFGSANFASASSVFGQSLP